MTGNRFLLEELKRTPLVFCLGWRWASRVWSLPCPTLLAWVLDNRFYERITGTDVTLRRRGLRPGQQVLEVGAGTGRLLIPAAQRVLPGGEVVGIDIQPGMIERLQERTKAAPITNLTAILGDATQPTAITPTKDSSVAT